jgi:hypothetical protein
MVRKRVARENREKGTVSNDIQVEKRVIKTLLNRSGETSKKR